MAWLLDTHALLWALFEPEKLGRKSRAILKDSSNDVFVSPISYWEISLKYGLGRLELQDTDPSEIPAAAREIGFLETVPSAEVFSTFHRLPYAPDHRDPFDRLLVWQAIRGSHVLISRDRVMPFFGDHGLDFTW